MGYCSWPDMSDRDRRYHDEEWGVPIRDDRTLFEHFTFGVMQCGLSFDLMLKKRAIFCEVFEDYDYEKVAKFTAFDADRIANTFGMIRSPRKIDAVINNARRFLEIRAEFGTFSDYLWGFTGGKSIVYKRPLGVYPPVSNGLSARVCKDMKSRGFQFVGPVNTYSQLQAAGLINDHDRDCPRFWALREKYPTVEKRRDKEVYC